MAKARPIASLVVAAVLIALSGSWTPSAEVGARAPFFRVKSGDDKELTLDMLQGKVISLIYESREVVEKNRKLKDALKAFFHQQPNSANALVERVAVVNCSSASWPIIKLWRHKLKENSEKEGIIIYGDWDGKMLADYGMNDNESTYVIIDQEGIIRYFVSGHIEDEEIQNIITLLANLMPEK